MMLNLFEIFDYCTLYFSLNWLSSIFFMIVIPQIYWLMKSKLIYFFFYILGLLIKEFSVIMINKFNKMNLIFFVILFMFILLNNFMGLFSYIFTSSSHLVFSLIFSLSMWLGIMLFGWIKNIKFMLIHLVPMGTPMFLMFFMVLIELLSNIIRPLTLAIRLTANMIAGHLLLTLLGNFVSNFVYLYFFMIFIQVSLMILELAVSIIQSYVFVVLMLLYFKETN